MDLGFPASGNELARVVLDHMFQFVALLDLEGRVLTVNRAALDGAGLSEGDVAGRPFWQARWWTVSEATQNKVRECIERARLGEFVRCDFDIYGADGGKGLIVIDFSLRPVSDAEGCIVCLLAEGRDISDKKRAELELFQKNGALHQLLEENQRLDRAKTEFFANISHELRTPLTLILAAAERLEKLGTAAGTSSPADVLKNARVIRDNVIHQMGVVNDLLDIARARSASLALHPQTVDTAALLKRCLGMFEPLALQRDIAFDTTGIAPLVLELDARKFERIVLNLVANAFKFTPSPGRVLCGATLDATGWLELRVADSGPGIPPHERQTIFERFHQGAAVSSGAWVGSGLGLAIVKAYVLAMQGTVQVGESAWSGALFVVRLPVQASAAGSASVEEARAETRLLFDVGEPVAAAGLVQGGFPDPATDDERPWVLVVDDNGPIRELIRTELGHDCRTLEAADGQQGYALAQRHAAALRLVITDLMMPRVGGEQLVRQLRADPALAAIPILVLTARDDDRARSELIGQWVQDYVTKPFSPSELHSRVRNLLQMHQSRLALQRELDTRGQNLADLTFQLIQSRRALMRNVEALQLSESRWRTLFEHSPAAVCVLREDGRILATNPAWSELVDQPPALLRGQMLSGFADSATRGRLEGSVHAITSGECGHVVQECAFLGSQQELRWCTTAFALLSQPRRRYVVVVAIDTSARRRAERDLERLRSQLLRLARGSMASALTASIAHEINQPLAAIAADARSAQRWVEQQAWSEVKGVCERMVREAQRASDVVGRLRQLLSDQPPECEWSPLRALLEETRQLAEPRLLAGDAILTMDFPPALQNHLVWVDRQQIQLVVFNLIQNAIEAFRSEDDEPCRIVLAVRQAGADIVQLSVSDNGPGIELSLARRIFEPFFTSKPHGMGLGLVLSQTIVQRHNGAIWHEPSSSGAHFIFTLNGRAPH